jgi:hypothetical protein
MTVSVVNVNACCADIALLAISRTPTVTVTTIAVPFGRLDAGVKVAARVVGEYVTAPAIAAPAAVLAKKFEPVMDSGLIASLNVTVMTDPTGTDCVPSSGVVTVTRGLVTSGAVIDADGDSAESAEVIPFFPFAETA